MQGVKVEGDRVKAGILVKKKVKKTDQAKAQGKAKKPARPVARPDNYAIARMGHEKKRVNCEGTAGHVPGIPPNYRYNRRLNVGYDRIFHMSWVSDNGTLIAPTFNQMVSK